MIANGRIPDRIYVVIAVIGLAITWGMWWWAWPLLPDRIPSHFNIIGVPDAWMTTGFWSVFILPGLGTLFGVLFWWLYQHPQYSNIPGSLVLTAFPEPERSIMTRLIRHFLVTLYLVMVLMFAHIGLSAISTSFGIEDRANAWVMLGLVVVLFLTTIQSLTWLIRVSRAAVSKLGPDSV